jgi:MFS family permease
VLVAGFVVIESRSKAPLLPLKIFRLRTLSTSNFVSLLSGATIFSQFFLLTLYMQQVLHYSALKTGTAYLTFTLSVIIFSGLSQALVTRIGIRRVLSTGLVLATIGLVLQARLPVHGHYFWDIFPAFIVGGIGLALIFVPMSIGALAGVHPADAGVASGLLNTGQQIGGAIGVAAVTTIATTFTGHWVSSHPGSGALDGAALTHGFQIAFYVLAAVTAGTAVIAALFLESAGSESVEQAAPLSLGKRTPVPDEVAA